MVAPESLPQSSPVFSDVEKMTDGINAAWNQSATFS